MSNSQKDPKFNLLTKHSELTSKSLKMTLFLPFQLKWESPRIVHGESALWSNRAPLTMDLGSASISLTSLVWLLVTSFADVENRSKMESCLVEPTHCAHITIPPTTVLEFLENPSLGAVPGLNVWSC